MLPAKFIDAKGRFLHRKLFFVHFDEVHVYLQEIWDVKISKKQHLFFWAVYLAWNILQSYLSFRLIPSLDNSKSIVPFFLAGLTDLGGKMLLFYLVYPISIKPVLEQKKPFTATLPLTILATVLILLIQRAINFYVIFPMIFGYDMSERKLLNLSALIITLFDLLIPVLMLSMYELYSYARRSRQREMFLEKEKLSSELNYLKAQINPHFLFNVLATVHALTIKKSPEAANVVVKLSELMRFMLFEVKNRKITVEEEINFLEGYIELEMVRFSNKLTVNFSKSIDNPGTKIEPLLLLPFVENAFKHGAAENRFHSFITIELKLLNDHLRFTVENATEPAIPDDYKMSIGLDNVKRQLQMLYPGHKLHIEEREKSFYVLLELNLGGNERNILHNH